VTIDSSTASGLRLLATFDARSNSLSVNLNPSVRTRANGRRRSGKSTAPTSRLPSAAGQVAACRNQIELRRVNWNKCMAIPW
jgi:hypothetical protein